MDQELKELLLSMQGEIKALRDNMNARFDKSDERMTKMEIHQENVTDKNIQLLLEGQQGMNEKFQKLDQVAGERGRNQGQSHRFGGRHSGQHLADQRAAYSEVKRPLSFVDGVG